MIDAKTEAEKVAVSVTVQAEAEKSAAEDRAEAVLTEAKADADAKILKAEADEKIFAVEAAGKKALYEAENTLSQEQIELQKSLAILKSLPEIVAQAVKPLENIEGIKILQGYGANGQLSAPQDSNGSHGSFADQVTSAALNYRANAPVVDALLQEVGLVDKETGSLNDLVTGQGPLAQSVNNIVSQPDEVADTYKQVSETVHITEKD